MINLVFAIIFIACAFGIFGFGIYKIIKLVQNIMPKSIDYKKEAIKLGYLVAATAISAMLFFTFISIHNGYNIDKGEWAELIIGSLLFAGCFTSFIYSFIIHYYGKEIPAKLKKCFFGIMVGSIVTIFVGLILLTNSFADDLTYPLVSQISFQDGPLTPLSSGKHGFSIAFYALFILSGAVLVYFISDHRLYQEYGRHGIAESTFFVAFPAGIVGARIGYVIGNWNGDVTPTFVPFSQRVANGEWWSIFAVWEGGLTIISGAAIGIIVGVAWYVWKNRKLSMWVAIDIIVPTILIAQAIGRWGNFFNCEVHGLEVAKADWWILPKIIANNMNYSSAQGVGYAASGNIYLPLFLIEGILNLLGYFFIRFAVGQGFKKHIEMGDLSALYLVVYGFIRVLLEPLRHEAFNMGKDGYWSWFWSFIFIALGCLAIAINHIVRHIIKVKKGEFFINKKDLLGSYISTAILSVIAISLMISGFYLISTNEQATLIQYNDYNNGLLLLFIGLSALVLLGTTLPKVISGSKIDEAKTI